jgi:hypothetical protein
MARPVLSETLVASQRATIGGGLISGSIRVTDPNCEQIRFSFQFAEVDILDPRLYSEWQLQEKKEGQAAYGNVGIGRGSAIGAVDNETTPSLLTVSNPLVSTSPPRRRYQGADLRVIYSLSGRPGGVDLDITAALLGADDGISEE